MRKKIDSVLKLERLQFKNISFERLGDKNKKEIGIEYEASFEKRLDDEIYRVIFIAHGQKEDEYKFDIALEGIFSFDTESEDLAEDFKEQIITTNTLAIMMPYLRSEISILTAQPGVDSVVIPPMNINNMINNTIK